MSLSLGNPDLLRVVGSSSPPNSWGKSVLDPFLADFANLRLLALPHTFSLADTFKTKWRNSLCNPAASCEYRTPLPGIRICYWMAFLVANTSGTRCGVLWKLVEEVFWNTSLWSLKYVAGTLGTRCENPWNTLSGNSLRDVLGLPKNT